MVPKEIWDYLQANKDNFPLEDLKNELLKAGWPLEQIQEAIQALKEEEKASREPQEELVSEETPQPVLPKETSFKSSEEALAPKDKRGPVGIFKEQLKEDKEAKLGEKEDKADKVRASELQSREAGLKRTDSKDRWQTIAIIVLILAILGLLWVGGYIFYELYILMF